VNKNIQRTDEKVKLERYKKHDIEIVIDRLDSKNSSRLAEAVESALLQSDGLIIILGKDDKEHLYSANLACPICGMAFEELQPRMFSFNSPFGACEACHGLGIKMDFDPDLIIPDKEMSIAEGAIALYRSAIDGWRGHYVNALAKHFNFDILAPISEMNQNQYNALMFGSSEKIKFAVSMRNGETNWSHSGYWEGLLPQSERLYKQTESDYRRRELEKFMRISPCPKCQGKRLKDKILAVTIDDKSIIEITDMSIKNTIEFFNTLKLSSKKADIAKQILKEIKERLSFLDKVGLNYLTLSRTASTLSGGEGQRIRLATQIGSNLMGVLYILDEPSIGLHQVDNNKLIDTLHRLRDLGNTLIVVEHDEDTIKRADYVVDMGPGAGLHGGLIVAKGTPKQIQRNGKSLTGQYLAGKLKIDVPSTRRQSQEAIVVKGCRQNNLKNIDIRIPIGMLNPVTGVSGSGKSTLVYEILYKGMMKKLYKSKKRTGDHDAIELESEIDKVIVIDQSPIGRTPRSNPVTYIKVFDDIRKIFAQTKEAKIRGYKPGRFSFNVRGGRCEACHGDGLIKIEMNFLPDVYVQCEECKGKRYNQETLEIVYKGKTISDVLEMSVEEALSHFENIPSIRNKLDTLSRVGLEYIKLGQSSITLSGGEAQRIKLTRELAKKATGKTLYLLDEPTTGLHFHDIKKLLKVLNDLVSRGNTIVVIEHNLDVIKSADHIIDLGPEGGDEGGRLIAEGTPEKVAKKPKSYTGQFLKRVLK
jgi:excinuclease ABC subunit A